MNISPISVMEASKTKMAKKQANTNAISASTNKLNKDTVSFTGNKPHKGVKNFLAGLAALVGIINVAAPAAKAADTQVNNSFESAYVEQAFTPQPRDYEIPLTAPTFLKEDIAPVSVPTRLEEETGSTIELPLTPVGGQYSMPPLPPPTHLRDEIIITKEQEQEFRNFIAENIIPKSNIVEENDDLVIVELKHQANINVLDAAAVKYTKESKDHADQAAALKEEASNAIEGSEEYADLMAEADAEKEEANSKAALVQVIKIVKSETKAALAEVTSTIDSIRKPATPDPVLPVPTAPSVNLPFPAMTIADSIGDIAGFDKVAKDYVPEIIPADNMISPNDSNEVVQDKIEKNNEILLEEAEKLTERGNDYLKKYNETMKEAREKYSSLGTSSEVTYEDVKELVNKASMYEFQSRQDLGLAGALKVIVEKNMTSFYTVPAAAIPPTPPQIQNPTPVPVVGVPLQPFPVAWVMDSEGDVLGFDKVAKRYIPEIISPEDMITSKDSSETAGAKAARNNLVLAKEVEKLTKEGNAYTEKYNQAMDEAHKKYDALAATGKGSYEEVKDLVNKASSYDYQARQSLGLAGALKEIIENNDISYYKVQPQVIPNVAVPTDPTIPPLALPIIDTIEMFRGYEATVSQHIQKTIPEENFITKNDTESEKLRKKAENDEILLEEVDRLREEAIQAREEAADLHKEATAEWELYFTKKEGSYDEIQKKAMRISGLFVGADRNEEIARRLEKIANAEGYGFYIAGTGFDENGYPLPPID